MMAICARTGIGMSCEYSTGRQHPFKGQCASDGVYLSLRAVPGEERTDKGMNPSLTMSNEPEPFLHLRILMLQSGKSQTSKY